MVTRGLGGSVLYQYQVAARLSAWAIAPASTLDHGFEIEAMLHDVDDVWITQRPLRLVLVVVGGEWQWADLELTHDAHRAYGRVHGKPVISRYQECAV